MSGMKKIILAGLSTMLLAACSDNELVETQQDVEPAATSFTRYMTVSIASNEASSTRAESASAGENKGIEAEYGVSKLTDGTDDIMFYLFDKDGNPYTGTQDGASAVTYDSESTQLYIDTQWIDSLSLYQTRNYIVKLNLKDGSTPAPAKIVAILNGTTCGLTVENATPTLEQLRSTKITTIGDDKYYRPYSKNNAFLMSNSAYGDPENRNTPIYAQAISEGNCQVTPELAKQNPVNIYVERVVSKVQLKQDTDNPVLRTYALKTESSYYTKNTPFDEKKLPKDYTKEDYNIITKDGKSFITNAVLMSDGTYSEPLILTLNGWNIFNTLESTTLEKDMTSMPTDWAWNNAAKFRSYWSNTSEDLDGDIKEDKLTWSEMKGKNATDICYPFENTLTTHTKTTDFNTSILFAGKIQTGKSTNAANAKDLTLFYWRNTYYTKDNLKSHWASLLGYIYTDAECKTPVQAGDIKFLIAKDGYHVYPYLKITDKQKFYHKVGDEIKTYEQDELADLVAELSWAQYWNGGNCYYFTTIKHPQYKANDADADGTVTYSFVKDLDGIVRNHWYQMSISTIIGLGTPVPVSDDPSKDDEVIDPDPNPDPEIDPVRPEDDPDNYWYLDVKCVIQPWQQVTNNLKIISKDGQTE
jgi:hypothetical protein